MGLSINETAPDFEADTTQGSDAGMIHNSVSDHQATALFGEWKAVKPYIRVVSQPR